MKHLKTYGEINEEFLSKLKSKVKGFLSKDDKNDQIKSDSTDKSKSVEDRTVTSPNSIRVWKKNIIKEVRDISVGMVNSILDKNEKDVEVYKEKYADLVNGLDENTKAPELKVLNNFRLNGTPEWIYNILQNYKDDKEGTKIIPMIHKWLDDLLK